MSEKPKPCPFCGEQLELRCNGAIYVHDDDGDCYLSKRDLRILPEKIGMSGWNKRARNRRAPTTIEEALSVPEVRALVEQMVDAMERVIRRGGLTVGYHEALRDARAMLLAAEKEEGR